MRDKADWVDKRISLLKSAIEWGEREGNGVVTLSHSDASAIIRTLKEYKARLDDDAYVPTKKQGAST